MQARKRGLVLLFAAMAAIAGCDGKYTVKGKVQFNDGSPLAAGTVIFTDEKGETGGYGAIQPDGSFEITYDRPDDGLPKGTYGVSVRPPSQYVLTEEQRKTLPPLAGIEFNYMQPETSNIKVTIDKEVTDLLIKLEKDSGKKRGPGAK